MAWLGSRRIGDREGQAVPSSYDTTKHSVTNADLELIDQTLPVVPSSCISFAPAVIL